MRVGIIPSTSPNGSTTDAVTNPFSRRGELGACRRSICGAVIECPDRHLRGRINPLHFADYPSSGVSALGCQRSGSDPTHSINVRAKSGG